MHVSADALGFQISFAVEPRSRPEGMKPAPDLAARLRARLASARRRMAEPRLEDSGAAQLADVGLPADWRPRWNGRSRSIDLACRTMMSF
jgi:hypothetical protein